MVVTCIPAGELLDSVSKLENASALPGTLISRSEIFPYIFSSSYLSCPCPVSSLKDCMYYVFLPKQHLLAYLALVKPLNIMRITAF
jgi:hypothetical protein